MSTITTINATDKVWDSRAVINTNFSNLNTDKIETSYLDTDWTLAANSDSKIATQKAVKTYVDSVADTYDLFQYKWAIDASTNPNYPAANAGRSYRISVAGKIGGASGKNVEAGEYVICHVDSSAGGNEAAVWADWTVFQVSFNPTDYVLKSTYDANTVLYATTDNTPVALTVSEQTIVGRATGGNIAAIAIDSDLSSVSANDDTIPSAKATKTALDTKLNLSWGTMTGAITLDENSSIALDPSLSADGKYTWITMTGTAWATLAFGDLIYLDPTDSRRELADANAAAWADWDSRGVLGICVQAAASDWSATTILLNWVVRADTAFPTFTVNNPIYVSETAWDVTWTQPTTTDVVIRVVWFGLTADSMYFNPSSDYITHT